MLTKRARMDGYSSRPGAINVQTAEYTRCKVKGRGKRLSKRRRIDQLVAAGINTVYLRCNGMNEYASAAGGYFNLPNLTQTGPDSGTYYPIWYFDIGSAMNWTSGPGVATTINYAEVSYRPFLRYTAANTEGTALTFRKGRPQFEAPTGSASGGFANTLQQAGGTGAQNTALAFGRAAVHKWVSAKLLCYGIANTPVRFRVSLIRFHKPHLCPGWEDVGFDPATNVQQTDQNERENIALQQHLAGPFVHHPFNTQQVEMRRLYTERVIKDFVIGGPDVAQGATFVPYMHQLDFFKKLNKMARFDWNVANNNLAQGFVQFNTYSAQLATYQNNVDFTKRWYLCVRAQSKFKQQITDVPPVNDTTVWPSFDFWMQNKWEDLNTA